MESESSQKVGRRWAEGGQWLTPKESKMNSRGIHPTFNGDFQRKFPLPRKSLLIAEIPAWEGIQGWGGWNSFFILHFSFFIEHFIYRLIHLPISILESVYFIIP